MHGHGLRRPRLAVAAAVVAATLAAAPAVGATAVPIPHLISAITATPTPKPEVSNERIPVSLLLANSIWTDDGSVPPAATAMRFELDKSYRLDLSQVERCPGGAHFDIRTGVDRCAKYKFASGRIEILVAYPENDPITVRGRVIAFKSAAGKFAIHAFLPAPVAGEIAIPLVIGRAGAGAYGVRATASIPKIAGGYGSLTYLGLRFRRGLFSATCPNRGLRSHLRTTFANGEVAASSVRLDC